MQAIAKAADGVILCYDTGGDERIGHAGEMTCQLAYAQGCRGMIVAGNLRDTRGSGVTVVMAPSTGPSNAAGPVGARPVEADEVREFVGDDGRE